MAGESQMMLSDKLMTGIVGLCLYKAVAEIALLTRSHPLPHHHTRLFTFNNVTVVDHLVQSRFLVRTTSATAHIQIYCR